MPDATNNTFTSRNPAITARWTEAGEEKRKEGPKSMKRLLLSAILGVGLLFYAVQAPAYVVNYETVNINGANQKWATGVTDLAVGSLGTYNVVFRYSTPSTFTFNNFADAKAAADAINVALNAYAIVDVVDTTTIPWSSYERHAVPYELVSSNQYHLAESVRSSAVWSAGEGSFIFGAPFMFAAFTPVASVPIPGAVWLLGSGLFGLVAIRRKFKK
jgi:hypothetical protein